MRFSKTISITRNSKLQKNLNYRYITSEVRDSLLH